jgi:hypothetical protein
MGNSPVTLDFSKAQPIALDFSKAQPLDSSTKSNLVPSPWDGLSQATGIGPQQKPTGWRDALARWADNVSYDMKYGTDTTGVGTLLKKMGAHGLTYGNSEAVADFMGSLPLGLLQATKGGAEVTQQGKTWQGTKDIVGGGMKAATIPSAFMGGPEAGATAAARAGGRIFGDADRAGQLFSKVAAAAREIDVPVTDEMYDAINNAKQLANTGAKGLPRVVTKFFNRITNVDEPLTWDEARQFYSNVSRLSANEYNNMAPQMQRAVGQFASAFNNTLRSTAEAAGMGDEYGQAMQLYARSKAWQKFGSQAWEGFKKALPVAGGVAAGKTIGDFASRRLLDMLGGE